MQLFIQCHRRIGATPLPWLDWPTSRPHITSTLQRMWEVHAHACRSSTTLVPGHFFDFPLHFYSTGVCYSPTTSWVRGGVRWSMKSQGHTFTVLARIGMQVNGTHLRSTRSLRTESRRAKPNTRRGVIPAMPCRRCEVHCWKGVWPWSDPTSKQWLQFWRLYKHWLLGRVGDRNPTLLTAVKGIPRRRLLSPSLIIFGNIFEYFVF